MSMLFGHDHIHSIFSEVNKELASQNRTLVVTVIGYSSLILGGKYDRGTEDIDIVNIQERIFYKHGFHLLEEHALALHPTYHSRLVHVLPDLTNLKVHRLDHHDLFLLKLDAAREKDISDLRFMIKEKLVDKDTCTALFDEWLGRWYNNDSTLRERFESLWEI